MTASNSGFSRRHSNRQWKAGAAQKEEFVNPQQARRPYRGGIKPPRGREMVKVSRKSCKWLPEMEQLGDRHVRISSGS